MVRPGATVWLNSAADILDVQRQMIQAGQTLLAIAFWGHGSVEALDLDAAPVGTRIIVNAERGGSSPDALEALLVWAAGRGTVVKNDRDLHAKVVLDRVGLVTSSANASSNGLGFGAGAARCWNEAGLFTRQPQALADAAAWFEERWDAACDLDRPAIERAQKAWDARLCAARGTVKRPAYVYLWDEFADQRAEKTARRIQKVPLYMQDWSKLRPNALIYSFYVEPSKRKKGVRRRYDEPIVADGEFHTFGRSERITIPSGGYIDLLTRGRSAPRRANTLKASVSALRDALARDPSLKSWLKSNLDVEYRSPEHWCVPLHTFEEALLRAGLASLPAATPRTR